MKSSYSSYPGSPFSGTVDILTSQVESFSEVGRGLMVFAGFESFMMVFKLLGGSVPVHFVASLAFPTVIHITTGDVRSQELSFTPHAYPAEAGLL